MCYRGTDLGVPDGRPVFIKQYLDLDESKKGLQSRFFMGMRELTNRLAQQELRGRVGAPLDQGIVDDSPVCVFLFIKGENLEDVLAGGVGDDFVPRFTIALAHTIMALHACQVVHFDLKPRNIMVEFRDRKWFLTIVDFDGAAIYGQSLRPTPVTTCHYFAPELAYEDLGELGGKADVYSFGVITYFLLFGEHPFANESDYWDATRHEQFDVPPSRYRREIVDLVVTCLAARPNDRPEAKLVYSSLCGYANGFEAERERDRHSGSKRLPLEVFKSRLQSFNERDRGGPKDAQLAESARLEDIEKKRREAEAAAERARLAEIERKRKEAEAAAERARLADIEKRRKETEAAAERARQDPIERKRREAEAAAAERNRQRQIEEELREAEAAIERARLADIEKRRKETEAAAERARQDPIERKRREAEAAAERARREAIKKKRRDAAVASQLVARQLDEWRAKRRLELIHEQSIPLSAPIPPRQQNTDVERVQTVGSQVAATGASRASTSAPRIYGLSSVAAATRTPTRRAPTNSSIVAGIRSVVSHLIDRATKNGRDSFRPVLVIILLVVVGGIAWISHLETSAKEKTDGIVAALSQRIGERLGRSCEKVGCLGTPDYPGELIFDTRRVLELRGLEPISELGYELGIVDRGGLANRTLGPFASAKLNEKVDEMKAVALLLRIKRYAKGCVGVACASRSILHKELKALDSPERYLLATMTSVHSPISKEEDEDVLNRVLIPYAKKDAQLGRRLVDLVSVLPWR